MTKEELEKEAIQYAVDYPTSYGKGYKHKDLRIAYLAGAEPREKRIVELEAQIRKKEYQEENYLNKIDHKEKVIKTLQAQIEKMKCCGNCKQRELIRERGQWKERFNCKGNGCICHSKWEIKENE